MSVMALWEIITLLIFVMFTNFAYKMGLYRHLSTFIAAN
jgi:hypothetical protein